MKWLGLLPSPQVLLALALAFAVSNVGSYWWGRWDGSALTEAEWKEKLLIAERAARQTEIDLNQIAANSARRSAEKERLLNEQARKYEADWRATLAGIRARIPVAVGVHLNEAAGVSGTAAVAGSSTPRAADPARDSSGPAPEDGAFIDLADTLDTVRENYRICRINIFRLTEASIWYEEQRQRIRSSAEKGVIQQ